MALASLGALITMSVTMAVNAKLQRDFAREWQEGWKVKVAEPLGERRLMRFFRPGDKD